MATIKYLNGGKYKDDNTRLDLITYVTLPNKVKHGYTNASGFEPEYLAERMQQHAEKYDKDSGVRARHFVLSFPRNEVSSPKKAYEIAQKIAPAISSDYQTVYAVHEDTPNLHIHFVHNSVNYDGERFKGTYAESHALENEIKGVLKPYGMKLMVVSSTSSTDIQCYE